MCHDSWLFVCSRVGSLSRMINWSYTRHEGTNRTRIIYTSQKVRRQNHTSRSPDQPGKNQIDLRGSTPPFNPNTFEKMVELMEDCGRLDETRAHAGTMTQPQREDSPFQALLFLAPSPHCCHKFTTSYAHTCTIHHIIRNISSSCDTFLHEQSLPRHHSFSIFFPSPT